MAVSKSKTKVCEPITVLAYLRYLGSLVFLEIKSAKVLAETPDKAQQIWIEGYQRSYSTKPFFVRYLICKMLYLSLSLRPPKMRKYNDVIPTIEN